MRNLICMTWGFSLPFFSSWKSQVASIIYTSLRLFLSFPLCSLPLFLPPSPLLSPGNLACAELLISILQNVQMPPKIIHLPALWCRFTCIQTTLLTFCTASQTKAEGQGLLLLKHVGAINATSCSLMFFIYILVHPNYIIHLVSQRFLTLWWRWMECFFSVEV